MLSPQQNRIKQKQFRTVTTIYSLKSGFYLEIDTTDVRTDTDFLLLANVSRAMCSDQLAIRSNCLWHSAGGGLAGWLAVGQR